MRTLGSVDALVAAVRDEAESVLETRRQACDGELDALETAPAGTDRRRDDDERRTRLAAAHRMVRERRAREEWLGAKELLEARERWVDGVVSTARRRFRTMPPEGRRAALARLAEEACRRLPGDGAVVRLAPADADGLGADWASHVAARAGKSHVEIQPDASVATGGCLATTATGAVTFDNTLEARSKRFEATWRAGLSALFDKTPSAGDANEARGEGADA